MAGEVQAAPYTKPTLDAISPVDKSPRNLQTALDFSFSFSPGCRPSTHAPSSIRVQTEEKKNNPARQGTPPPALVKRQVSPGGQAGCGRAPARRVRGMGWACFQTHPARARHPSTIRPNRQAEAGRARRAGGGGGGAGEKKGKISPRQRRDADAYPWTDRGFHMPPPRPPLCSALRPPAPATFPRPGADRGVRARGQAGSPRVVHPRNAAGTWPAAHDFSLGRRARAAAIVSWPVAVAGIPARSHSIPIIRPPGHPYRLMLASVGVPFG